MRYFIILCAVFMLAGCAHAQEKPITSEADQAMQVVEKLNEKAEIYKLKIQLLQAQRKQVEYEYTASCYKDKRWRDYTSQIESLAQELNSFLIGAGK